MKITLINGSHRPNGQSQKVALYMQSVLCDQMSLQADILSLAGNPLPLWDQGVWDGEEKWQTLLTPLRQQLSEADGFVVISPEYHGQVPAGLKNFFLLFSKNELGHKPALITTVSSGEGGAYPVAELRMSSYKNNRICYLPEHLILRKIESVLNANPTDNDERSDSYYRARIAWSLSLLQDYAEALKGARQKGRLFSDQFKNGM